MAQSYSAVEWVDETATTKGTLITKARLDAMQTAHHYADGFREVDAIPTEPPEGDWNVIVFCTQNAKMYRYDREAGAWGIVTGQVAWEDIVGNPITQEDRIV